LYGPKIPCPQNWRRSLRLSSSLPFSFLSPPLSLLGFLIDREEILFLFFFLVAPLHSAQQEIRRQAKPPFLSELFFFDTRRWTCPFFFLHDPVFPPTTEVVGRDGIRWLVPFFPVAFLFFPPCLFDSSTLDPGQFLWLFFFICLWICGKR